MKAGITREHSIPPPFYLPSPSEDRRIAHNTVMTVWWNSPAYWLTKSG